MKMGKVTHTRKKTGFLENAWEFFPSSIIFKGLFSRNKTKLSKMKRILGPFDNSKGNVNLLVNIAEKDFFMINMREVRIFFNSTPYIIKVTIFLP